MSELVRVCALSDLPEQGVIAAEANGIPLVIARSAGEVFALSAANLRKFAGH